ncbi:MAG: hypothetical protein C4293_17090, partial [Nitrospiraceae bacterium]
QPIGKLQDSRGLLQENDVSKRDQEALQGNLQDLERRFQASQQDVARGKHALEDANRRFAELRKEKEQLDDILAQARNQIQDLESKLRTVSFSIQARRRSSWMDSRWSHAPARF